MHKKLLLPALVSIITATSSTMAMETPTHAPSIQQAQLSRDELKKQATQFEKDLIALNPEAKNVHFSCFDLLLSNIHDDNKLAITSYITNYSKISKIPDSIGNFVNLESIVILDSDITALPESIGKLKNLSHLDLRNNKLKILPESIGNCINLVEIKLDGNKDLSKLPIGLESLNLKNLKSISIWNTPLEQYYGKGTLDQQYIQKLAQFKMKSDELGLIWK